MSDDAAAPITTTGSAGKTAEDMTGRAAERHHPRVHPPGGTPSPPHYRVGPQKQHGIHHTKASPSIFENYSGPQVDAAKTIVKNYMALLDWPQSIDTEKMALDLLKNGLENKPQDAFEHLWNSKFLTSDMRKANPWARFGQDADTYHQNLSAAQDLIKRMTGMDVSIGDMAPGGLPLSGDSSSTKAKAQVPNKLDGSGGPGEGSNPRASAADPMSLLLQNALKYGWSQQQIMDALQAGSFTSIGGTKVDLTGVTAAEPWLLSGQTYQQQAQQFRTIYGAAPVDTAQLAGWYRFNQQASQIGPWYARQAIAGAPGKGTLGTSQTEVR